ncbi:PREDICTED: mitochondrial cardiolipin hydrolase-like [Drosophila arizonae]|uniref:Mitochondrial cardiolipin hydrolase n=1 Tax=Drosophila arizonae TaxID=7263 RepID=A0ABM1PCN5_DROAR|nr:PREDICTED: mitochondrial cardiolipin hydrolase-like [Drosophila arizonae]
MLDFWIRVSVLLKRLLRTCLSHLILCLEYGLYRVWLLIYNEPDDTDVVLFNELPLRHRQISRHISHNCPKPFCELCRVERIVMYMERAKVSIDIAMLTISHSSFYSAIDAARLRGIQVRLITDSQMIFAQGSVVKKLVAAGLPARRSPPDVILHNKFCIIDGEQRVFELDQQQRRWHHRLWYRRGYVLNGSLNWTKLGTVNNFENVVITSNRVIIALYENLFNDMWKHFPVLDLEAFDSIPTTPFDFEHNEWPCKQFDRSLN